MEPRAFDLPSLAQASDVTLRLLAAAVLGGALGFEREVSHKPAGLRTHMLVALGAAIFVLASTQSHVPAADVTRVVQGIATGIGFVGAGAIIKRHGAHVEGITTASGIWLTAAIGVAVAQGAVWIPVLGVVLALLILVGIRRIEGRVDDLGGPRRE